MWIKILLLSFIALTPVYLRAQQDSYNRPEADTVTDYTLIGATMPFLQFMCYKDTSSSEIEPTKKRSKKRSKKHATANGTYTLTTGNEMSSNGNLLVMIFSPECGHCKAVTNMLQENMYLFNQSQLLLLTTTIMKEYIPEFARGQNIKNYPSFYLGYDSSGYVPNTFLYQPLPQINIYNKERKLLKIFTGETPIDSLKKYID